jgi:hypothetical protein
MPRRSHVIAVLLVLAGTSLGLAEELFVGVGFLGEFVHLSSETGQVGPTSDVLPLMQAAAHSPDGEIYVGRFASGINWLHILDPITGETTEGIEMSLGGANIRGMAVAPDGTLYVSTWQAPGGGKLQIVDPTTGEGTVVTGIAELLSFQGLAISPLGEIYGVVPSGPGTRLVMLDPTSGVVSVIAIIDDFSGNQALEFTPDGRLFALGGSLATGSQFAELDPETGALLSSVYPVDGDQRGLAWIPEPASLALLFLAAACRRR